MTGLAALARALSEWLARERTLLPLLAQLGASSDELSALRGGHHLLEILASDPEHKHPPPSPTTPVFPSRRLVG